MRLIIILLAITLAGCSGPNDPGAGGVTRGEADALNSAAAKLDTQQPESLLQNKSAR